MKMKKYSIVKKALFLLSPVIISHPDIIWSYDLIQFRIWVIQRPRV